MEAVRKEACKNCEHIKKACQDFFAEIDEEYPKTNAEIGKALSDKKSLKERLKEIYLDERLMDHERRIQTYNLLIYEFSPELNDPRDTEPERYRLDPETGKCAPASPLVNSLKPIKQ